MAGKDASQMNLAESQYAQAAADFISTDDFPVEFVCPITQTLMQDPVLTVQGNVYERAAITEWLQSHTRDPLTNSPLTALTLVPCNPIKSEIEAFRAAVRKLGPEAAAQLPTLQPALPLSSSLPVSLQNPGAVSLGPQAIQPYSAAPHTLASPVAFAPMPQPLTTRSQALKAVLQCHVQVSSYQSIIGTYLQSKQQSALVSVNRATGEYAYSRKDIRLFNHVMHKLESLSASVISSRQTVRPMWVQAVNPFRRQLFNTLYSSNDTVQAFAGGLPGGRLELPRMDNWTLGIWRQSAFGMGRITGSRLDTSRNLLSQVHTVLLIDDSGSMNEVGNAAWGYGRSRWDQVRELLSEIAPILTQYDPQGMDLHFLNHRNAQQGLQSSQQVQAVFSQVRPAGATPLGLRINTIMDAYMSSLRYERHLKPLNLVVITDGKANDERVLFDTLEEHVGRIVQRGHPAHQMGIEFLQVGDCQWATAHLYEIEEAVSRHHQDVNRDVVGVTPVTYMQQQRMSARTLMQVINSGIDARVNGYLRQRRINI